VGAQIHQASVQFSESPSGERQETSFCSNLHQAFLPVLKPASAGKEKRKINLQPSIAEFEQDKLASTTQQAKRSFQLVDLGNISHHRIKVAPIHIPASYHFFHPPKQHQLFEVFRI